MLECGLLSRCINKTTIRNNYWIILLIFHYQNNIPIFQHKVHFFFYYYYVLSWQKPKQKSLKLCHKNLTETKWKSHSLYIQRDPLSGITFRSNTGQREKITTETLSLINGSCSVPGETYTKSLELCHKKPRETTWSSHSLYIQRDPLIGIIFWRNTSQTDKTTERKR